MRLGTIRGMVRIGQNGMVRTMLKTALACLLPVVPATPAAAAIAPLVLPASLADASPALPLPLPPPTDLDAAVEAAKARFQITFSAMIANGILKSVGLAARDAAPRGELRHHQRDDPFAARLARPVPPDPTLAMITNPRFGSRDTVAVSVAQKLVPAGAQSVGIASDIHLDHQSDRLDAGLDLAGYRDFSSPDPLALRYDGHALVAVSDALKLGLAARGQLGSPGALAVNGTEIAGPLLRLNLGGNRLSVGSDLGYDFGLNAQSEAAQRQLHARIELKIKL